MIQFGNSSVEIRWVIQDGKVLHCFSSRCYHWLYGTVSWWDYYYFFQVNFSLHSFVISYEHRLQPGLNFIQDETFWVCNFTLLKSVFEFVSMSEYSEHFFVSSLIYSYLASLGPQSCRKRVVLNGYSILLAQSARPHYCARSSGPSEFLAIRLEYVTEMYVLTEKAWQDAVHRHVSFHLPM